MLGYFDLRRGVRFIYDGQPWEVLDFNQMKKAQREGIAQVKMKNLITGKVMEQNFHSSDSFDEADIKKLPSKFLYSERNAQYIGYPARYSHRDKFFFSETGDPSKRFDLTEDQIGPGAKFLKAGEIIDAFLFKDKIISVGIPIKIKLKVTEAPPGIRGNRAQGGMKTVVLETGAVINAPLFVETGDVIEINTETGEYVRRAE